MHAPLKSACIRIAIALASITIGSGCTPGLPRLQEYAATENSTDLERSQNVSWVVSDQMNLDATLAFLDSHPDELTRSHAGRARMELDRMANAREERFKELMTESLDEIELVTEIGLVVNQDHYLDRPEELMEIREVILDKALSHEAAGRLGEAMRYANALNATDSILGEPDHISLSREDPLDLYRRNRDRVKVIRMIDSELAGSMESAVDIVPADRGRNDPAEWPIRSKEELADLRRDLEMILDHMVNEHVSSPDRLGLHEAGIDEVLFMCEVLEQNGYRIPSAYTDHLDSTIRSISDGPSDRLLMEIQESERDLAGEALPPGFSFRVFGDGAVGSLDKQSSIIWPDEFEQYTRSVGTGYRGIGVSVGMNEHGEMELNPMSGGPASKAGIRKGDVLISVDGIDSNSISVEELTIMASEPDRESLELLVRHLDGIEEDVNIRIGPVRIPQVTGWRQIGENEQGEPRWSWMADPVSRIGYLKPNGFRMDGEKAIRIALQQAQQQAEDQGGRLEGLVIDLRGNPGGHVHVAVEMCNLFMQAGTAFRSVGRDDELSTIEVNRSYGELEGMPLVVLMDSESASASELVSGVLKESNDALIIGERSYGKGSVQSLFPCRSGDCLARVTGAWYQIPSRDSKNRSSEWTFVDREKSTRSWGVEPDIPISLSRDDRDRIADLRTRWYSEVGHDVSPDEEPSEDPEVSLALALIRARMLAMKDSSAAVVEAGAHSN